MADERFQNKKRGSIISPLYTARNQGQRVTTHLDRRNHSFHDVHSRKMCLSCGSEGRVFGSEMCGEKTTAYDEKTQLALLFRHEK